MINIDDIKNRSALTIIADYQGKNPYLRKLKWAYVQHKTKLTENQLKYIIDNHDKEPVKMDKIVRISTLLGEELQKQDGVSFTPEKVLIEYLLADTEKAFHILGKLKKNQQESKMYWLAKTQVFDDIYFDEINVDVDFEKYKALDSLHRDPYEHQKVGVKFLLSRNGCILADDMGLGKALSVNELVYTPSGLTKISELKKGDYVIGSNGNPTKVIGVYPQGVKDLYRVTFNDGYSTLCCKEHLWTVSSNNSGENSKNRGNKFITLSVEQMLDENLVIQHIGTGRNEKRSYEFKTYYKQRNGQNKWQIPIVKPIKFSLDTILPIDPYLLGLCLGDGHIMNNEVRFSIHDGDFDELFGDYFNSDGNYNITEIKGFKNIRKCKIIFGGLIRQLKLNNTRSHTKFIPDIYKFSSIKDRLAILRGLMDTDGHCMKSKNGKFAATEYCTVSEQLANDVAEIVHSLGGIVRLHSKIGSYKKEDGTKIICKKVYILNIKLPYDLNPFKLKRKSDLYNPPKKYKVGRYIIDIKLETKEEAVCIKVDAPDHLFVIKHGIITHNTYQSIVAALESGAKKVLIVCPSSVKINWEREINNFNDNTAIVSGRKWKSSQFTIINYDILKNFHTVKERKKTTCDDDGGDGSDVTIKFKTNLVKSEFDLVIIDEAHYLKNPKSIRGKIMNDLCVKHNIEKVWLLTGTPITNRPMDYYNLLHLIKAPIAENWVFYAKRYCDGKKFFRTLKTGQKKQIWLTDGASNLEELAQKTRNVILRRKKEDALDMPDKTRTPMFHELDDAGRAEYDNLWDEYLEKRTLEGKTVNLQRDLTETILLRRFIAKQSIPNTIDLANSAIEQGQKVIIFTTFTDELLELQEYFGKECVVHYGKISDRQKQFAVDKFQNDPNIKIFIGNIISAGVGINLTAANIVIFNSFDWVPGNNDQGEDRAYRIGQKNNVTVYYHLFMKTVSTAMWKILYEKRSVISIIMNERNVPEDIAIDIILKDELENES